MKSSRDLLDMIRRWLRTRPGRMVLVGATGFSALLFASVASAQEHHPAPPGGPDIQAHPAPEGQQPSAGQEVGEHGGAHEAEHGGEHAVHHPEPFNFADVARYSAEKARAERGDKDAHGNPITPVVPYAYLLINFAILVAIYYRAGKKPISEGLAARSDEIAKELVEAQKIKAEAEARATEYATRLEQLEGELARIKAEMIKTGEADRERLVKEAEEKAERMRKDAQFLLDQEMKQLRNDMLAFTVDAATAAAEQVLKAKITAQDQDRLADEYLRQLGTVTKTASAEKTAAASAGGAS